MHADNQRDPVGNVWTGKKLAMNPGWLLRNQHREA